MTGHSAESLTARIRAEALRLGFFKVGVASAGLLPWREHFDLWLDRGMHGEMAYMLRQAPMRREPRLVLEDARSILVLAMNYYPGNGMTEDPLHGRISRYAWGEDYHETVKRRLIALEEHIARLSPGARTRSYTDTGPVMEKVWGARSGLGWMGKNGMLLARGHGSWFFLGVILLDLELSWDSPERDYCGRCVRCLEACPTGAILAPRLVDARRCISYLTIEHRGAIPRELRPLMGNRIFGCDDCQEVCPWNRFAAPAGERDFLPRGPNFLPDLAPLAGITKEEFRARFRSSTILRTGRDRFVRNVVVALGNSRRPKAISPLARALGDDSPLVRAHAAWALGRIGTKEALEVLDRARAGENDPAAAAEFPDPRTRPE